MGSIINFLWAPAHYAVKGKEMAVRGAKGATKNSVDLVVNFSKTGIKFLKRKWKINGKHNKKRK